MSFPAKWAGRCADCEGRFEKGTEIGYNSDDEIVHGDPSDCSMAGLVRNMNDPAPCPTCFLVHRGDCF